jgi:hypothetical protein
MVGHGKGERNRSYDTESKLKSYINKIYINREAVIKKRVSLSGWANCPHSLLTQKLL